MAVGATKYAPREFDTIRAALIAEIEAVPEYAAIWTDYSDGNPGIILLELIAFLGEWLEYSLDFRVQELYLDTAELRESVYRIAKSFGYPIPSPSASSVDVVLDFGEVFLVDLTLPSMAVSVGGKPFYYAGGGTLPLGDQTVTVTFTQGELLSLTQTGDNTAYQEVDLGDGKIPFGSVTCTIGTVQWTLLDSIALGTYDQTAFELFIDEESNTKAIFGNQYNGKKPPTAVDIVFAYLETEGQSGIVGAGAFENNNTSASWYSTEAATNVTADMSNAAPSAGGTDGLNYTNLKRTLLAWLRAVDAGVTEDAIMALALAFSSPTYGSVSKCTPYLTNASCAANWVYLWVAVADTQYSLTTASTALKAAFLVYMNERKIITVEYYVQDPTFIAVNLALTVKAVTGTDETEVKALIEAAIKELFSNDVIVIGQDIFLADLYDAVRSIEQVEWVVFTSHTDNIEADPILGECLQLGTIATAFEA